MHTLFGITLVLYLLKLSAGKGLPQLFYEYELYKSCTSLEMNTSKDQHLAIAVWPATIIKSKLANSHENIQFDRSKLYMFVELVHFYCNSSTSSASKFRLAKCEASCEMRSHAN